MTTTRTGHKVTVTLDGEDIREMFTEIALKAADGEIEVWEKIIPSESQLWRLDITAAGDQGKSYPSSSAELVISLGIEHNEEVKRATLRYRNALAIKEGRS